MNSTDANALDARKDIDLLVHDANKAHTALLSAHFHVSGRGLKRKAWIRTGPEQRVVKLDLHQDAALVASQYAEETVEKIHIATPVLLLTLTLQGLGTVSRSGKVDLDIMSTRWLVQWLVDEAVDDAVVRREDLACLITVAQRNNWANILSPEENMELLVLLQQLSLVN